MTSDHRTFRLLDGAVLFWVVLWCVLGVWTGVTLWQAADVGDTLRASGESLSRVGEGLSALSEVPVIGERPGEIGSSVAETAVDIISRGTEVKDQLRLLGVFLGIAIIGIPVTPVLGLYLPVRVHHGREVAALRRQLTEHGDDPGFDRHLADRARSWLPYSEVVRLAGEGAGARAHDRAHDETYDRAGERRLADAELGRLGLRRPRAAASE